MNGLVRFFAISFFLYHADINYAGSDIGARRHRIFFLEFEVKAAVAHWRNGSLFVLKPAAKKVSAALVQAAKCDKNIQDCKRHS